MTTTEANYTDYSEELHIKAGDTLRLEAESDVAEALDGTVEIGTKSGLSSETLCNKKRFEQKTASNRVTLDPISDHSATLVVRTLSSFDPRPEVIGKIQLAGGLTIAKVTSIEVAGDDQPEPRDVDFDELEPCVTEADDEIALTDGGQEIETGDEEPTERWDVRGYATNGEYTTYWMVRKLPDESKAEILYQRGNGEIIETDGQEFCTHVGEISVDQILDELKAQAGAAVENARKYYESDAGPKKFDHGPVSQRHELPESCGWQSRADDLHELGGVPKTRAKVAALIEAKRGLTDAGEVLDMDRRNVHTHIKRYREEDVEAAQWLTEHGSGI